MLVMLCCLGGAEAMSVLSRVATAVRQPLASLRWQYTLLEGGRRPMRLGVDLEVRSNDKGRGLYALRTLDKGAIVGRYTGDAVPGKIFEDNNSDGLYAMELANGDVIDGANEARSSFVRFINHSVWHANCMASDAWEEGPIAAVYIETLKQIKPGEELFFNCTREHLDSVEPPSSVGVRACSERLCVSPFGTQTAPTTGTSRDCRVTRSSGYRSTTCRKVSVYGVVASTAV